MNVLVDIEEIEYTQNNARAEYDKGNYTLASVIYGKLWDESNKRNMFLLSWYGRTLRKLGENQKFIDICDELDESLYSGNQYLKDILCWSIYDSYIKNYSVDNQDGFSDFIERSEFIINKSCQLSLAEASKNPYVLTVMKVVKAYNKRASVRYKEIIKWLLLLNPDILSEEVFSFVDNSGKDRELASPKEFYYQNLAKAYEKTEQYEECIAICETAFDNMKKFHYRNQVWLKARMLFCKCMIQEDVEQAIEDYRKLADKENLWFMYHKLSGLCFRYNKIQYALFYACKSLKTKFEHEKMVNLFYDTALLWGAVGNKNNAKLYFHASAYYRTKFGWSIPEELKYAILDFDINADLKPDIRLLQKIAIEYIESIEGCKEKLYGSVIKILSHGGAGFIRPETKGENIFFSKKDIKYVQFALGDQVEYELENTSDGRTKAINIKKRSE
ncbi:MAG TPA: hypothetical protein VFD52_00445 [Clostridia bacterium]|nr:hypothetical protein [Clostridia bacterium]